MLVFLTKGLSFSERKLYFILLLLVLLVGKERPAGAVYAKEADLPVNVQIVEDEEEMLQRLQKAMRQHQMCISFYYPGIGKVFKKYQSQSGIYQDFFDKLARKDGYTTGIISGSCVTIGGESKEYVTFQFGYLTTKRQERYINKKVKSIVKRIGKGSRVFKVRAAHDYLTGHMQYDSNYYNPYYAFSKGRGMCMSYALAYQRILQEMKIPCVYIKGKDHAWNMVKIGGYWYNVDVTWDDCGNGTRYFLKSDSDFPGHKRPKSKWLSSLRVAKKSYPYRR